MQVQDWLDAGYKRFEQACDKVWKAVGMPYYEEYY